MARRRNAPLKGVRVIGSNMTEVEHGDLTILYSYETPVAFLSPKGGYVTDKFWSNTTSRHIAKFFQRHGYDRKGAFKLPQEDVALFVTAGKVGPQSSIRDENPRHKARRQYYEFTDDDIGSHIDGAFGHDHAMARMADMLGDVASQRAQNLLDEYDDGELDDEDEDEWLNDATEALQEVTAPGLTWEWEAGDLALTQDASLERPED